MKWRAHSGTSLATSNTRCGPSANIRHYAVQSVSRENHERPVRRMAEPTPFRKSRIAVRAKRLVEHNGGRALKTISVPSEVDNRTQQGMENRATFSESNFVRVVVQLVPDAAFAHFPTVAPPFAPNEFRAVVASVPVSKAILH